MNELSLFSGAGGGILGSQLLGWRTIGYVENNEYAQRILRRRIDDGFIDTAPIFTDVETFTRVAHLYRGFVDVVSAGFPCQPFSIASKTRAAEDDERNGWPATVDVIERVQPEFCYFENVRGLLSAGGGGVEDDTGRPVSSYFGTILRDLAALRYSTQWIVLGADDVGGRHIRKRLWIRARKMADSDCSR